MTEQKLDAIERLASVKQDRLNAKLKSRYARERRFQAYGIASIAAGLGFLVILLTTIFSQGLSAFWTTYVELEVTYDPQVLYIDDATDADQLRLADYGGVVREALLSRFPDVSGRQATRELTSLVSNSAEYRVRERLIANPELLGQSERLWVLADDDLDLLRKGIIDRELPESERRISDQELSWIDSWNEAGELKRRFNTVFFTNGDSRDPETAGIWGAVVGSFYTLVVTLLLSFPIGVAAAIYLEEFAPKNRLTDIIEVNINNLAAVPSIVFGLLGLAVFINFFGLPRSAPVVGGLVLTLMTLPTIIISARSAIRAVPPSIREAATGLGASKMQVTLHHVLPLAMPGMLTGTIIGMAQALGETAPLLMIGMVAFIVDIPGGFTDPSTVLPVQVYLWSDSPERAFIAKTSGAIMVLLGFLAVMNLLAVFLRKKFERRW
ncbi:phosphate ABC transporter, permease protein PstA [Saccharospirillum sp. MSK14-1]|uniref:phosphate ABC transporter permease PstA n=1 Tax=Saccharospirillum sp. MSK14-1 TaxID=1897632 RepID=UPI000D3CA427|nr:phosphate ABC transporter permease PstA [Saccharospirillum sp. MSK14-1]PTY35686.1 phosphate ABC transporter, permease protein PstA [Saccharospirillum sp. MSK14-1]